jgi:myosin heavy subunit
VVRDTPEDVKPMSEASRKAAELFDKGLDYEAVAKELGVDIDTVRHRYAQIYRNYIRLAKERILEYVRQGMDSGEAAAKVKEELNITDAMAEKALYEAGQEMLKQLETQARAQSSQTTQQQAQQLRELEELKKEGEAGKAAVEKALRDAGLGLTSEEEIDKDLIQKVQKYRRTLESLRNMLSPPLSPAPPRPGPGAGQVWQAQPEVVNVLRQLVEVVDSLAKDVQALKQQSTVYIGRLKKVKVGDREEEYGLLPKDSVQVMQAKTMTKKVIPEILGELKGIRSDLSSLGNRFLSVVETYLVPKISKLHPALESSLPITLRTPEQRERELAELEKKVSPSPPPPKPKKEGGEGGGK